MYAIIQIALFDLCLTFLAVVWYMLDVSTINPYIRVAMHSVIPAGNDIQRRIIFDYELIYVEDGAFVFTYNDVEYLCRTGQFLFIRPNVSHSFTGIHTDLSQPHVHFDVTHAADSRRVPVCFKDSGDLTQEEKRWIREDVFVAYEPEPMVVFNDRERALRLFYEIVDQSGPSSLSRKAKLIELLDMLIADNYRRVFEQDNRLLPVETQVKAYIDSHQGFSATLEDFAKQFSYSRCHLDRCFQRRYGVGIIAYRNRIRMQTGAALLRQQSVTAVAEALGFSSIYAFSRAFKSHFGVSPTVFGRSSKEK